MNQRIQKHLGNVLKHLYINPLEKCNLRCKICYTKKTSPILSNDDIMSFIARYQEHHPLETVTFCGGEVFALTSFPTLVNQLTSQGIFVQVITNGTIDQLDVLTHPNLINLIVSLDGLESYHDANRGEGNFAKSIAFMKKAHSLGFHVDVFSIITRQNMPHIEAFEEFLTKELGFAPGITYHPRKPPTYLLHHPVSNIVGETDGFDFLSPTEMMTIMQTRNVFPPKDLGCYQIALTSNGRVYGCCEGTVPLGTIDEPIETLTAKLTDRIEAWDTVNTLHNCLGCSQHEFMCGIKEYLVQMQVAA